MKVKKYVVDSLPQAMGQIKTDLGNDAMILHTKKVKIGGFLGFFGKEKIEVIAAVDTKASNSSTSSGSNISNSSGYNYSNTAKKVNTVSSTQASHLTDTYSSLSRQSRKEKDHAIKTVPETNKEVTNSITSEVSELKKLMIKMMMNQSDEITSTGFNKNMKLIYERLTKQGVIEEIASGVIEEVIHSSGDSIESLDLYQKVKKKMIDKFNINGVNREIRSQTRVVHFVGPTGVGKTTTIAKLAAEKVLKHKKKIAFITADTYRIGAVDQLRTYAEILHAPIEVVFSPQDTQKAIEKLKNYDLIFMDTAGRNYHNEMYISELNNILAKTTSSETFLVLSLTHKFEDMVSILEQFKKVDIDKILFTKFDETLSYGSILNITSKYSYEVSYVTHGQNVPDDIEVFDEEKIANAILGVNII